MARENNVDLGRVKGTGAGGRITKQDVEAHLAQAPRAGRSALPPLPPPAARGSRGARPLRPPGARCRPPDRPRPASSR